MAGSQDQKENPVAINVVPMVDVIFCLCIFFMCSFKFKEVEGKFDSWLPRNKGADSPLQANDLIEEVRVALLWDTASQSVKRKFGHRFVEKDDELETLIAQGHKAWVDLNKPETPVIIDGDHRVPWREIVNVMNLVKRCKIEKIEFAMGKKFN